MEKENKLFLLFVFIIVCALLVAYVLVNSQNEKIISTAKITHSNDENKLITNLVEVPVLTDEKTQSSDPIKHFTIEVSYPKVALAEHPELAKDANNVIAAYILDTINSFKEDVDEAYSPSMPKDSSSDLNVRWSALLVSPTIISIRFDESEYVAGSAHPNTQARILNYDLEKHLLLQTADLFASSSLATQFLSNYSRNQLELILTDVPKDIFKSQTLPGTEPTTENFSSVGITKQGLLIIFSPYQVAPYARGTIQVPIPLSDLNEVILPRIKEAIEMATTNIAEGTPVETGTSSINGSN